ncbi:MerR family transcriptional regulator, partial [Lactobacillus crispatus]|uniref:MerR family transcriptional regulator n=1 Tax=Lactobacillus crispatus TaxID=47770 RepID=UPI00117A77D6
MSRIMYLKEAAAYLGKAPFTLQSWDRAGKLKAHRTANNRRFYYHTDHDQSCGC